MTCTFFRINIFHACGQRFKRCCRDCIAFNRDTRHIYIQTHVRTMCENYFHLRAAKTNLYVRTLKFHQIQYWLYHPIIVQHVNKVYICNVPPPLVCKVVFIAYIITQCMLVDVIYDAHPAYACTSQYGSCKIDTKATENTWAKWFKEYKVKGILAAVSILAAAWFLCARHRFVSTHIMEWEVDVDWGKGGWRKGGKAYVFARKRFVEAVQYS